MPGELFSGTPVPSSLFTSSVRHVGATSSPTSVLRAKACPGSCSQSVVLSNQNGHISSRPTPAESSHLRTDLAGCAQPPDLPPSLSLPNRAACCSPSNHNHTLPCAFHSSLRIALLSLFSPPFYSFPYRGHPGECQQSLPISGCSLVPTPSLRLPPPSSACSLMQNTTEGFDLGQPPNHSINIVPERGSVTSLQGFSGECVGIKR